MSPPFSRSLTAIVSPCQINCAVSQRSLPSSSTPASNARSRMAARLSMAGRGISSSIRSTGTSSPRKAFSTGRVMRFNPGSSTSRTKPVRSLKTPR